MLMPTLCFLSVVLATTSVIELADNNLRPELCGSVAALWRRIADDDVVILFFIGRITGRLGDVLLTFCVIHCNGMANQTNRDYQCCWPSSCQHHILLLLLLERSIKTRPMWWPLVCACVFAIPVHSRQTDRTQNQF